MTEFETGSEEYDYARKSVLAEKLARNEGFDGENFGFAALDISILDGAGNPMEPSAAVYVDMKIKSLPGVENLGEVADSLAIWHHVEAEDGVVVENVFRSAETASFTMETNATVLENGSVVNPEDLAVNEDGEWVLMTSFTAEVFSTFTVTWGSLSGGNVGEYAHLQVNKLTNGNKYILYGKDATTNRYYALVPSSDLHTVEITLDRNQMVQYSGEENLYWNEKTGTEYNNNKYYSFYFTENGNTYYLAEGTTNDHLVLSTSEKGYDDSNTTKWRGYNWYLHSATNTFMRCENEVFKVKYKNGFDEWTSSEIYFERYGAIAPSYPNATIHYVDEQGTELTVSKGSISSSTLLKDYAYLIYDIEGGEYEYKETYIRRNSSNTAIKAYIQWNDARWKYQTINGNTWSNINDDDDIYVVYKKKKTPTNGGTPTLVELTEDEKPERPSVTKGSAVNGDGTNTLSLSVTSHTKPREVLKLADVIVIFDRSGSMKREIDSQSETNVTANRRMTLLQNAVNSLAEDLIGENSAYIYTDANGVKHKQIEMSLVTFSNLATDATAFTDNASTFKGWVNALSPDGGTNWEQALQKANEASVDSGRATFIIFVTDGEPTFRMTRMTDTDGSLNDDIYFPNTATYFGTYYRDFHVYGTGHSDNQKDGTDYGRNYRAALLQAQSIVSKNKNLYMIGVGPEVGNLDQFHKDANANGYYPATSSSSLTAAFNDIKRRIVATAGYSDFTISDGITDLTQTVQKSALVSFVEDDFTYYKGNNATTEDVENGLAESVGDMVWESWDPAIEGCAEAVYKPDTGTVEWNMGSNFMPLEGYTYQVRFKVWPSQAAYDLLADLNNGITYYSYSDYTSAVPVPLSEESAVQEGLVLSSEVRRQISPPASEGAMYTLKTNDETSYNYKEATIVDGTVTTSGEDLLVPPGSFPEVDPLKLTTRPLKIKKQWEKNYVDSRTLTDSITMKLYGVDPDGTSSHDFKEITLTQEDGWYAENNYISYGLVTYDTETNAGAKIYETGHDFTLREIDEEAHYYELTAGIYRPMFINGTPTILERVDAAPSGMPESAFHYSDGAKDYYRFGGYVYRNTESDILLLATNSHRSYMDITKTVVAEDGGSVISEEVFTFTATFTVPSGIDNYEMEQFLFVSIKDERGNTLDHVNEVEQTEGFWVPSELARHIGVSESDYSRYDATQRIVVSGVPFTMKLKPGQVARFVNLPKGTIYSIQETNIPEGYAFLGADVSGTKWISDMASGEDAGEAAEMANLPVNDGSIQSNAGVMGIITEANARYKTLYTNQTKPAHVKIYKTSQEVTPLQGAIFSLYTKSGYEADPKAAVKTGLTSDAGGMMDLGNLSFGKYFLEETYAPEGYILLLEPIEIGVTNAGVVYNQASSSLSLSNEGVRYDPDTEIYTLTVTNDAGMELPATGGMTVLPLYLLGILLITSSGFFLLLREQRSFL